MSKFELKSGAAARAAASWLVAMLLVAGCGGGGGGSSSGQGLAFTQGTISGFGSVIVNGVRFDDSAAQVVDDEDGAHDRSALKLGMTVEIQSGRVRAASAGSSGSAEARHIRFGSEIVGPVTSIGTDALTVLGQTIEVTPTTVFDDGLAGGLAAINPDDVLEVHALFDTTTLRYVAKRIELKPNPTYYKLRGVVSNLDTQLKTFKLGEAVISYSGIADADLPSNFADGLKVRVRLQTTQVNGQWEAVTIRHGVRKVEDHDEAEVRGIVDGIVGTDLSSFTVNGLPVTTSDGTTFPDGKSGIVNGAMVEVEGAIVNGVLVATKVELEDAHNNDDRHGNELHGAVADLDKDAKTFTVRGVKVHYGSMTMFMRGSAADLANDKAVEVRGRLATDGVTVEAMVIKFE